jgi:hypothetical protein
MKKEQVSFMLTREQEKIVLPLIKKAEKIWDKKTQKGAVILGQMIRYNKIGDVFATAVFIDPEYTEKFILLRKKYDKYLESKEANPKK